MGRRKKVVASEQTETTLDTRMKTRSHRKELECRICHFESCIVAMDVGSVICDYCVALMAGPPELPTQLRPKTGYPRGWHLKMIFISEDGKYFSKGVEVTKEEAKHIKAEIPVIDPKRVKRAYKKRTTK